MYGHLIAIAGICLYSTYIHLNSYILSASYAENRYNYMKSKLGKKPHEGDAFYKKVVTYSTSANAPRNAFRAVVESVTEEDMKHSKDYVVRAIDNTENTRGTKYRAEYLLNQLYSDVGIRMYVALLMEYEKNDDPTVIRLASHYIQKLKECEWYKDIITKQHQEILEKAKKLLLE